MIEPTEKNEAPTLGIGASVEETGMSDSAEPAVSTATKEVAMEAPVSTATTTPFDKKDIDLSIKPEHFDKLSKHHQQVLVSRAVPVEYALRYQIRSFDLGKYKRTRKDKRYDNIAHLPIHDTDGILMVYPGTEDLDVPRLRFRVDSTTVYNEEGTESKEIPRYLTQSGLPIVPWICHEVKAIAADVTKPIFITEAPIKAMAMSAHGWPAIGLGGVSAGCHDSEVKAMTEEIVLAKEWRTIAWTGRTVYIVYDAGIEDNASVAHGAAITATALRKAGADVRFVVLPFWAESEADLENDRIWWMEDQGPDDFIARNGREAMQKLIDEAIPACPVKRVEAARQSAENSKKAKVQILDLLQSDLPLQAMIYVGGKSAIASVAAIAGVGAGPVAEAAESFRKLLVARMKAKAADKEEARYAIHDGKICMNTLDGPEPLCNFWAKIVANVTHQDGVESKKYIALEGGIQGVCALPRIEIPAEEFERMEWVIPKWGTKAIIRVGPKYPDRVREAIQLLSTDVKDETVYNHTGWRVVDGKRVFLHEGMSSVKMLRIANGDDGAIDDGRAAYELPEVAENVQEAVRASLELVNVAKPWVSIPALAAQYRAPLTSFLKPDVALWFSGLTGSGKSALQGLMMRHWGKNWRYNKLKFSWSSTKNALELGLNLAKDVPCVIDNFIPGSTDRDNDEVFRKCRDILQAIGDQSSRCRLNSKAEAKPDRPPRGMVIITGEDVPRGPSTLGRTFLVQVNPGDVDLDAIITYPPEKAELLPHAMKAYVDWIAANWDVLKDEVPKLHRELQMEHRARGTVSHNRDPNALAHLELGWTFFLRFAVEVGAITKVEAEIHIDNVRAALHHNMEEKSQMAAKSNPTNIILDALCDGIETRRVLVGKQGEVLPNPGNGDVVLGWDDGAQYVYVLPNAVLEVIQNHSRRTGIAIEKKSVHQLGKELAAAGILESDELVRPRLGDAGRPRVWKLRREHLRDSLDAEENARKTSESNMMNAMDDLSDNQAIWN